MERLQGIKNASTVLAGRQILLSLKLDLFAREWAQVGWVLDLLQTDVFGKVEQGELKKIFQISTVFVQLKVVLAWFVHQGELVEEVNNLSLERWAKEFLEDGKLSLTNFKWAHQIKHEQLVKMAHELLVLQDIWLRL